MKVYEYARCRNVKSRIVVEKLQEMGVTTVKNHLSLVPLKLIDQLDEIDFISEPQKQALTCHITLEMSPIFDFDVGDKIREIIKSSQKVKIKPIIILPIIEVQELELVKRFTITFAGQNQTVEVYRYLFENCDCYLMKNEDYFNLTNFNRYQDSPMCYAFFTKAVIALLAALNLPINKFIVHNWPLGLIPLKLKEVYPDVLVEFWAYYVTYKGIHDKALLSDFNISEDKRAIYAGSVNMLKAGLVSADQVFYHEENFHDFKQSYLKSYVYDN